MIEEHTQLTTTHRTDADRFRDLYHEQVGRTEQLQATLSEQIRARAEVEVRLTRRDAQVDELMRQLKSTNSKVELLEKKVMKLQAENAKLRRDQAELREMSEPRWEQP